MVPFYAVLPGTPHPRSTQSLHSQGRPLPVTWSRVRRGLWRGPIANVTAALRWRISPRWSRCLDFPAQMNLVASMLSQSRWAT